MNAQLTLTIWVILAAVCGVYLLGLFRTDHDHDEVKVGPVRLLCGSLFLILALYLSPALFGRMPQGPLLNTLVGLFPPDFMELGSPRRRRRPARARASPRASPRGPRPPPPPPRRRSASRRASTASSGG